MQPAAAAARLFEAVAAPPLVHVDVLGQGRLALVQAAAVFTQLEVLHADAQQLQQLLPQPQPLPGAGFDAAVCRLGLMFCTSPLLALQGIHQALVPGGRFSGLVFAGPERNPCIATLGTTAMRHAGLAPASPLEPGTLMSLGQPGLMHSLLAAAGFTHIDIRALDASMRLPSVKH